MKNSTIVAIAGIVVLIILIIGAVFLYGRSGTPTNPVPDNTSTTEQARITFPAGEEILLAGQTYTLTWLEPNPTGTSTQIFLIDTALESQGASVSIVDRVYGVPNAGSYSYTIPKSASVGVYKFEIGTLTSNIFHIASSTASSTTN